MNKTTDSLTQQIMRDGKEHARVIAQRDAAMAALRECITEQGALAERNHDMALRRLAAITALAKRALAESEG